MQNTSEIRWETPLPLVIESAENVPPYPIHSLPKEIHEPILNFQQYGQQPLPLIACAALANVSLACQTMANVARDQWLVSPISLYFISACASGERKSNVDKAFSSGIRQWQSQTRARLLPDVTAATLLHQTWRAERDSLLRQLRQANVSENSYSLQAQLKDLLEDEPNVPLLPELFFEDVTQEALVHTLSKGWPSSSLWSDEGGIILSGNGMQTNTTKFITTLSRLWDGTPLITHRKTSHSFVVENRRFTVSMMLQPLLLKQLLKRRDEVARQSGFLARTLMTKPISAMGGRYYQAPPTTSLSGLESFHERITECLDSTLNLDCEGCHSLPTLKLSSKAKAKWITFFNQIESGMNKASHWESMQDFASKAAENVARLSALFHLFLGKRGDIGVESVEQAIDIIFWHLLETKRIFEPAHHQEENKEAQKMLQWIKSKNLTETTSRYLQQYGGFRDKSKRDKAINTLIEHHYLVEKRDKGKVLLLVNPK